MATGYSETDGSVPQLTVVLLTPKEAAKIRRCSERKLDRERAVGRGCPYVRIDGRIFYRRSDIEIFIAAHVRGAGCPTRDGRAQ